MEHKMKRIISLTMIILANNVTNITHMKDIVKLKEAKKELTVD